ncbi:MAG TPA: ATPase domain-containing protein [Lacunisphaera sp.]
MNPSPKATAERCKTGIEGLDDILDGGLPRNRIYLILGRPGVGKTTMALQFLMEGVRRNERSLYITLSETKEELHEVARAHGWDLSGVDLFELSAIEAQLKQEADTTFFNPSEVELSRTTKALLDEVERVKPTRVVFDSLSELQLLSETALRYRRQILHLKQFFAGRNCTVLLLDDGMDDAQDNQVESLAHGVIMLERDDPAYGIARRMLHVRKIRGVRFREGKHDILLKTGGVIAFPRLVAAEHHTPFVRQSISSSVSNLDALLGGGLDRGTTSMFLGPPGTGKSTLAVRFALSAAQSGEKVLFFTFDETKATLLARARELGMDIAPHMQSGQIQLVQVDPAEVSPGEFAFQIKQAVQRDGVRMLVIDSINGYMNAVTEPRHLNLQLHELMAYLNQQGVTTILVLTQQGVVGLMNTNVDLTYLSDTVVLLRYFEAQGEVRQAVSVIKKRSGSHERTIRRLELRPGGIVVGDVLREFHGVLSGIPVLNGSDRKT